MTRLAEWWDAEQRRTGVPRMRMDADEERRVAQATAWAESCGIDLHRSALGHACFSLMLHHGDDGRATAAYCMGLQESYQHLNRTINERLRRANRDPSVTHWTPPPLIMLPSIDAPASDCIEPCKVWARTAGRLIDLMTADLTRLLMLGIGDPPPFTRPNCPEIAKERERCPVDT